MITIVLAIEHTEKAEVSDEGRIKGNRLGQRHCITERYEDILRVLLNTLRTPSGERGQSKLELYVKARATYEEFLDV